MCLCRNARVEIVGKIWVDGGDHRLLDQTNMEQLVQELRREITGPVACQRSLAVRGAEGLHLHDGLLAAGVGASGLSDIVYFLQQVSAMENGRQSKLQCGVLRCLSPHARTATRRVLPSQPRRHLPTVPISGTALTGAVARQK